MKEFVDDNFKLDENGRKLYKGVENNVGKGEIARYKKSLLFTLCFIPFWRPFFHFHKIQNFHLRTLFLEESKLCNLEKG